MNKRAELLKMSVHQVAKHTHTNKYKHTVTCLFAY